MLLFCAVVLARTCDMEAERVSIELQTRFRIANDDCGVIDTKKQPVFLLPLLIALALGELQNLEPVFVWIAKVECLDAAGVLVPIGQTLWTTRRMFDFVLTQQRVSLVHVARNDGDMLKPTIVAA